MIPNRRRRGNINFDNLSQGSLCPLKRQTITKTESGAYFAAISPSVGLLAVA
jgi:hypothetical protein